MKQTVSSSHPKPNTR
jgi:hypothetical protein